MACPAPFADAPLARAMLDFVDCQALSIGETGYRALAAPGSSLSLVLTALFTIFVALIGYRLLLGGQLTLREGVLALVKIGLVLALATGWSSYRVLIYDVALRGPAEVVADIGEPAGVVGAGGGLADRLQGVDDAFGELLQPPPQGVGVPNGQEPPAGVGPRTAVSPAPPVAAPLRSGSIGTVDEYTALRQARLVMITSTLGAMAVTRLIAGILLAIGPFFIAFLLFDGTRGLFEGWVRVLGGAALGAMGASLILGLELAYIEPILATALDRRQSILPLGDAPFSLLAAAIVFALVLIAVLAGLARLAAGLRLPGNWRASWAASSPSVSLLEQGSPGLTVERQGGALQARSRAASVVDAVESRQRWDEAHREPSPDGRRNTPVASGSGVDTASQPVPLGQSFRRQTRGRVSAGINRRNAA